MSGDFVSAWWSWIVAIVTVLSVIACALLLWIAGKARVSAQARSRGDNTTGHVWDEDLCELNNPLPRWWMGLFMVTVVFGLVYLALYPGLGGYEGVQRWSQHGQHQADAQQMRTDLAPLYAKFLAQPVQALSKDPQALAIGQRHFMNHCSQCHGSDGRGGKGYPNLTLGPAAWLGPLTAEHIVQTISQGRQGVMPAMGAAIGSEAAISDLAHYVLSLSGSSHNEIKAFSGKQKFSACSGCHGADGKGNKALGAPNLADNHWLHGWGEAAIVNIIKNGKTNVMPAQSAWLSPEQIHVVSAYVLSLSGAEPAVSSGAGPTVKMP